MSRHAGHRGLSAWRLECLTREESGEGMEIPDESTRARRSGLGSHACLGPEPRGVRATRARARAPSPGPRGKKKRRSHAASGSLSFQNKATTPRETGRRIGRDELLRETEAEDQKFRRWASALLRNPAPWLGCTGILGPSLGLWSVPFSLLAGFYPRKDLLVLISGHYSLSLRAQFAKQPPLST